MRKRSEDNPLTERGPTTDRPRTETKGDRKPSTRTTNDRNSGGDHDEGRLAGLSGWLTRAA